MLRSAGLVAKARRGREQIVTSDAAALAAARHVLDALECQWRERLDRFGDLLAELPDGDPT